MERQNKTHFSEGISWFILSLLISIGNDGITKHLGGTVHPLQVAFLRFLLDVLTLLPVALGLGKRAGLRTQRPGLHVVRGILLFAAISLWCTGLSRVPMAVATALSFTIPLFTLLMVPYGLGERVPPSRWLATLIGFAGAWVVVQPHGIGLQHGGAWPLLASAALFALLDVLNKRFVVQESTLSMLLYPGIMATVLSLGPAYAHWQPLGPSQWVLLAALGGGSNLILYALLKAFAKAPLALLAPLRYLELLFSAALGIFIFHEVPQPSTLLGLLLILPSTAFVLRSRSAKA